MKIELLSPAGSLANLKAAIAKRADSVYLGLNKFNAREFATNFNKDYLKQAINLCKSNNVKVYLTANTLIKNSEINEFFDSISYADKQGIDSIIIQDPSFIEIIKKSYSGLKIHISTQAGVMNSAHANLLANADRIILARELSKENIKSIRKNFKKELELFVHGALCVCISGSCLFSSFIGKRSGNRGKCAQPCRREYNSCYYLSTKELCLIKQIPELIALGIDCLKIEGRMRTPYYVATTTSIYRKAIDSFYNNDFKITNEMIEKLKSAFSREFTEGCFSNEDIFNKLKATGTSEISKEKYKVKSSNIQLKERESNLILPIIKKQSAKKRLLVRVYNKQDAIDAANSGADIIYYDIFAKDFLEVKNSISKPLYALTQRIMFDSDVKNIINRINEIKPAGLLAGNLGILNLKKQIPEIPIHLDYNCNCFNDYNLQYLEKLGAFPIISPELSIKEQSEFKNKNFASFVHGKIRLMTLAHKMPSQVIRDEKGFKFNINNIYNGSEVLNEKELGLFNKSKNLIKSGINNLFIDTDTKVKNVVSIYRQILDGKTIDVSKIKNNYVLGWSEEGVL